MIFIFQFILPALPCKSSKEGATKKCKERSILYETNCTLCNPEKSEDGQEERNGLTRPEKDAYIAPTDRDMNKNPNLEQDKAGSSPIPFGEGRCICWRIQSFPL